MKKLKNNSTLKIVLIVVIMAFVVGLVTYGAFFTTQSQTEENQIASGCFDTSFTDSNVITLSGGDAFPMSDADGLATTPYHFELTNTCTVDSEYYVILSTKTGSFSNDYLKYSVDGTTATQLSSATQNTLYDLASSYSYSYILDSGTLRQNDTATYDVNLWIKSTVEYSNVQNGTWEGEIKVVSVATQLPEIVIPTGAETLIAKANASSVTTYSSGTTTEMYTFTHSDIDTTLATQVSSWTSDELTDYRYIGANPNNYVYFNCTDTSDTSTCEVWRIIGVFTVEDESGNKAQRIKLIRNATIGNLAWNSTNVNEWVGGSLATLLNSGDYYTRSNTYASNGLTASAKSMIDEKAKYYLGGYNQSDNLNGATYYSFERGETVYTGRSTSVVQEVGLMYPSDYVYTYANGVDSTCYTDAYDCDGGTPSTGWIYNTNTAEGSTSKTFVWTISPLSDYSNLAFFVDSAGFVYSYGYVGDTIGVRPVVYLNSDVGIDDTSGDGSSTRPYSLVG